MKVYRGKTISGCTAVGKIFFYEREKKAVPRRSVQDPAAEWDRYEKARKKALKQSEELYEKALKETGKEGAEIFRIHGMLLDDEEYNAFVRDEISDQKMSAEYAVDSAGRYFSGILKETEDEYFQARAVDVEDISCRIAENLQGEREVYNIGEEPVILVSRELTPSETVRLDKDKLLGMVTEQGSVNSHVAVLARIMDIPALAGVAVSREMNGRTAIIDGASGELILDPPGEMAERYREKQQAEARRREQLLRLRDQEDITVDGKKIRLSANIGSAGDLEKALAVGAGGIGLFRSEFLYLGKDRFPTEEEQFQEYRRAAEAMGEKPVIIRTLDIGADKKADYFQLDPEENPALGYRAIRICLERPEILRTQLRAILRAAAYGNVGVMYPLIISVDEVRRVKKMVREVQKELEEEGVRQGEIRQGVMVETPAAVMISASLAKEVQFLSIGTNDLTQYTLAVDRQNSRLESLYDAHHPAVLEMIRMTVENAHRENCRVGICGDLGADPALTKWFLEMGVDELSVPPSRVLEIREKIRKMSVSR